MCSHPNLRFNLGQVENSAAGARRRQREEAKDADLAYKQWLVQQRMSRGIVRGQHLSTGRGFDGSSFNGSSSP